MDRPTRPSSSRIPSAGPLRTPSARTPLNTRTPLSTLGKRPAAEAGLSEDPAATRRALTSAQGRQTTLERKVLELQRLLQQRDEDIEDQRREIAQLKQERGILLEGETKEKEALRAREDEWAEKEEQYTKAITHYRTKSNHVTAQAVELEGQYHAVVAAHSKLQRESRSEIDLLEGRLKEVEGERDALKGWQRRAESLSIELEELRRKVEQGSQAMDDVKAEKRANEVVLQEIQRQSQNLITLQNQKDELQVEVTELRKYKKEADSRERSAKQIERDLRDEVRSLNVELERARHELDSLTQVSPSSAPSTEDAQTLQNRLSTLSNLHNDLKAQFAEQTKTNDRLHARLTTLANDSQSALASLTRELDEAKRELRWAKEGRQSAEAREKLLKAELSAFHASGPAGGADSAARVRQLEALVETYKTELEGMSRDSRDAEERLAKGSGLVKAAALEEAETTIKGLEEDIANLQETVTQLTAANTTLDAEVAELMRRVWSGEFNPERERCLELKANPAAKIHAVRTEQLENLKSENAALLDRLAEVDKEPSGSASSSSAEARGLVPRISYDRLLKEKTDLEAAHEKRLRRLKEIFGAKSREFLEAVYSLLGWRIKFDENGADIRLTSMYAPKGKMGLTLKFTSNEGHFGTMAMMGGMARSLEEARDFWVTERQSIPGFLAQVTTEMFEKTTLGRAAGYVGLE